MTQLELAKKGILSLQMKHVAKKEGISEDTLLQNIADGTVVIPANLNHSNLVPCGIGKGLRIKINANLGVSPEYGTIDGEMEKLQAAIQYGADAVMDLSIRSDIIPIRQAIIKASKVPAIIREE